MSSYHLFKLALLVLLLAANGQEAAADQFAAWPRWRGGDGKGGWIAPPLPDVWPADHVRQIWRQPLGPGYSGIAVAQDRVFTQDRIADRQEERVLCFAAGDGQPIWEYRYPAEYANLDYGKGPRATPLVLDGRVYTLGAVGQALCLDADTGELIWSKQVKDDFGARQPMWGFAASPIHFQGQIILHIGAADACYIALDSQSGEVLWRGGSDNCGYATPIVVQHQGEPLLIGWTPENVLGINPSTGDVYWQIPYPVTYGVSIATPVFEDGMVFVSGYWEGAKAIRLGNTVKDVELAWEDRRQVRALMAQPLFRDGFLYVLDKQQGLVCCQLATGEVRWADDNRLTPSGRNPHASLVWAGQDGQLLALNSDGELVLARCTPQGFSETGRTKIVGETWAHPAFSGPFVFARDDQQLVCVRIVE